MGLPSILKTFLFPFHGSLSKLRNLHCICVHIDQDNLASRKMIQRQYLIGPPPQKYRGLVLRNKLENFHSLFSTVDTNYLRRWHIQTFSKPPVHPFLGHTIEELFFRHELLQLMVNN